MYISVQRYNIKIGMCYPPKGVFSEKCKNAPLDDMDAFFALFDRPMLLKS